jgi:hypothetical protein
MTNQGESMRPFLLRLLEQRDSPYAEKFEARTVNGGQVARCRACNGDIYPQERDDSLPFPMNTSTRRWEAVLVQHQAWCLAKRTEQ